MADIHSEDTDSIYIPSVFVSRVSYLGLRDLLANHTDSGRPERDGLWIEISEGMDEGGSVDRSLSPRQYIYGLLC